MIKEFYSNGKLLLTGEYTVLDGAMSLAIPTAHGQSLSVTDIASQKLIWKSFNEKGNVWFEGVFELGQLLEISSSDKIISETLLGILSKAQSMNPKFLNDKTGHEVETNLTFPRDWGLGSSSTLINNVAQWANVDPYELLTGTFSGSGYDIACARHNSPITYQLKNDKPIVNQVSFDPPFRNQIYFVHLNRKQNSREGIAKYEKLNFDKAKLVDRISKITQGILVSKNLNAFEALMEKHEKLLSDALQTATVKQNLFADYFGTIKSLGAWGGDFIMATGTNETVGYFTEKGYPTVIPFEEMIR